MSTTLEAVRLLVGARRSHQTVAAAQISLTDAAVAYAVQDGVAQAFGWFADAPPRHWKSGGPSRDAVLTHAPLPSAGVWASPAQAAAWPFHFRGIEAEVALRLDRDVGPELAQGLDRPGAEALIDAMCVSIEVVDSRWTEGVASPALSKLADLQLHGALVLGTWTPYVARDWSTQTCRVQIGKQAPVERRGSHALADPTFVLPAWLRHATRTGNTVAAGTIVTTGTWVGLLQAAAGDLVTAEFAGIGQASVQF
jgi:2-keto-4-pentenoate hydratase